MGFGLVKPDGGLYLMVEAPSGDETALVEALLKEHILTLPGVLFRAPGFIRVSFCVEQKTLEGALPGFKKALAGLSGN